MLAARRFTQFSAVVALVLRFALETAAQPLLINPGLPGSPVEPGAANSHGRRQAQRERRAIADRDAQARSERRGR